MIIGVILRISICKENCGFKNLLNIVNTVITTCEELFKNAMKKGSQKFSGK